MEAQSYTAQERRAANQVWAAAGAYGFEPLFLAHNTDGTVDFYMNTIVGLVHKYYGDKLINSIFDRWAGDLRQAMLDDLAWLYLENAAYRLELPHRPMLEALRDSHADYFFAIQYKLSRQEWMARNQLVYTMQAARWRSVLGRNLPVMTPYESGLFRALAPDTAPQPDQLQDALLAVYAKFDLFDGTVHPKAALHLHLDGLLATLATKALPTQMIKTDRVTVEHSNAVDAAGSGPSVDKRQAHITLKQNAAQDRAYIESCFGRSLYPPERLRKAEQELCTGVHLGCHLWFSAGVPSPEQAPTPEARHLAEQAELQADRNRAYYAKNQELHRSVVLRLTEQIRNCMLVHQQPNARVARSGNVDPGRVWRAPLLNDDRVFLCAEEENHPAFTVDLLLDASASRLHCQEVIAAQGSILAESLANCGIPVRVSAFSSLRGYTVLRVLKDFADKEEGAPKAAPLSEDDAKSFDGLVSRMKEILGDKVKDVTVSTRLADSAACLSSEDGMTSAMDKFMRVMQKDDKIPVKTLEVNKDHPLLRSLLRIYKADAGDKTLTTMVQALFDEALLMDGYMKDPQEVAARSAGLLEQAAAWYAEVKKL